MLASSTPVMVPETIARDELARRELARRHLVDFGEYALRYYRRIRHHVVVAEMLEQVETYIRTEGRTGIGRLLIMEPPRHGKSEQASVQFPAWLLGKLPDSRVILTSYGLDRAAKNSRLVRGIVNGERFRNIFGERSTLDTPVAMSTDSTSVEAWDLAAPHRGGVVAAGVGGGITGLGAHYLAVDDPVKNREEAESEARRELVWDWWTSTAYTRLEKGGAVVGMLTHWHGDDWAGRLLKAMANNPGADQWVVVCLMAIWEEAEREGYEQLFDRMLREGVYVERVDALGRRPGEALWPGKYGVEDLEHIQANIGPYEWEALYQQRPYSRSGNMFRREWFTVVDAPPQEVVRRVRAWDKAGTAGGGARTSGVHMSLGVDKLVYVEDVTRGQWSSYERDEQMVRMARVDNEQRGYTVVHHPQDPGSAGKDSAEATNAKLAMAGIEAHFAPVTGEKEVRAGPWSSALEAGKVRLVRGGWNQGYIDRHVAFPKGPDKDDIDASADAYLELTKGIELDGDLMA